MTTSATLTGANTPEKLGKSIVPKLLATGCPGWRSHPKAPAQKFTALA